MFEDREPIWPQTSNRGHENRRRTEPYPWRVEAEPVLVLAEEDFVPAEELAPELEHVRKWPRRALAPRLPGPAADDRARPTRSCCAAGSPRPRAAPERERGARTELLHERHFTREEANALLPRLKPLLRQLRDAKDELTDEEAHEALSEAARGNGGGEEGRQVGVAFLEVRRLLEALEESGIVLRDIDRGLRRLPGDRSRARRSTSAGSSARTRSTYWHDARLRLPRPPAARLS